MDGDAAMSTPAPARGYADAGGMSSPPPSWTTPESRRGRASRRDSHARPLDGDSSEDERLARLDLASSAPLAAARRGARDPLVRRASAHAFLRGRELFRASLPAMRARPGVRDFVADASVPGCGVFANVPEHTAEGSPPFVVRFCLERHARGEILAVADEEGTVALLDASRAGSSEDDASGSPPLLARWAAHDNAVFDARWCRGDRSLLTASGDQTVRLWDVETEVVHRTFAGHRGSVKAVATRPEDAGGDVFASCGRDGALALWDRRDRGRRRAFEREPLGDANGGVPGARFGAHGEPVSGPISVVERAHEPLSRASPRAFSSARRVNTRGAAAARRRAAEATRFAGTLTAPGAPSTPGAPRSDDGASVGRAGRVFSPPPAGWGSSSSLASRERGVTSVAFLHDGRVLASAGAADGAVKLWDVRMLARGAGAPLASLEDRELPVERGGVPGIVTRRARGVTALALAPRGCGARLCAAYSDSHLAVFDAASPELGPLCHLRGHRAPSFYVKTAFSPDGTHVASGSCDRAVHVWRVDRPTDPPAALRGHEGEVTAVDWCPRDFSTIASCADDDTARVWTIRRGGAGGGGGVFPASVEVGEGGRGRGGGGDGAGRRGGEDEDEDEDAEMEAGEEEDAGEGEEAWWRGDDPSPSSLIPRPSSSNDPRCRTPAAARERARAPPSAARRSPVSGGAWIRAALEEGRFLAAAARRPETTTLGERLSGGDDTRERAAARGAELDPRPRAEPRPRPATLAPPRGGREGRRRGEAEGGERRGARGGGPEGSGSILTYFTPRRGARDESDEEEEKREEEEEEALE